MKTLVHCIALSAFIFSTQLYAYTDCSRPVKNVWSSLTSSASVWITFSDGGGAVYKSGDQVTVDQMNRLFSQALAAQSSEKKLSIRYPENNLSCPPPGASRNDIQGAWILKE